ncbi:hypothetical protein CspeluHIS016_0110990 [Cutaneotrichosporon spelunceum]|uniref:Chromo domain-containing protein n=1 Tax=Cutaneotrichosporon spelunceum TaxID=1672016 RepID=A0AAD3TPW4_9TREE|nr:hypothetical protein CspeluHIS016_0110990 [Cutaneotrichosporon spelunceum]
MAERSENQLPPIKRRGFADEDEDEELADLEAALRQLREREDDLRKMSYSERPGWLDADEEEQIQADRLSFTFMSNDGLESSLDTTIDVEAPGKPTDSGSPSPRAGLYPPSPKGNVTKVKSARDNHQTAPVGRHAPSPLHEVGERVDEVRSEGERTEEQDAELQHFNAELDNKNKNAEAKAESAALGRQRKLVIVSEGAKRGCDVLGPGKDFEPTTLHPLCLAPIDCQVDNHWVYLFFRFCAERHAMYTRRAAGVDRGKLTEDETMKAIHIGNVYRHLDPSSVKVHDNIIGKGDQSLEEVCFRVFLFCMFYKDTTWEALCKAVGGNPPTWKNYEADMPAMEAMLHQMSVVEGQKLWRGSFQIVPPTVYFAATHRNQGKDMAHYASSLRLVLAIMKGGIPARLAKCTYAVDASYVLRTIPTLGGFLGLNILCFLNDTTHFKWQYRDFATCGPGSRAYLQRIFGKNVINNVSMEEAGLRWLTDNQWQYWARLGLDPPHEWEHGHGLRPGMRVLDVENSLCWAHRYVNAYERKRTRSLAKRSLADIPAPTFDPEVTEKCGPPAWCVEEKWLESTSRAPWDGDHDEADDRVESMGGDDIYEVEKVIARLGNDRDDPDGLFRVRWTGWMPEWDTWERGSSLCEDAEEALEEWRELERNVSAAIEHVKKNKPFKWLDGRAVKTESYTPRRDIGTQAAGRTGRAERAAKRARVKE